MAVVLSEFVADNENGLRDASGVRQDWIEVANTGAAAIDLGGYYLSDDAATPAKWRVPDGTTIAAGGRLVVFASGLNLSTPQLHTNFQLEKSGEDLLLVGPDGSTVIDAYLAYPAQKADASYGRGVSTATSVAETLVGAATAVKAHVPTGENAAVDDVWREPAFNDAAWLAGTGGIGFDRNTDGVDLTPFVGRTLSTTEMSNTQVGAYVRFPFQLTGAAQLTSLSLSLRFDDGFIAYLNGREVARANFAEDFARPQPQWDSFAGNQVGTGSTAGSANRVAEALTPAVFDLAAYLPQLVDGTNVLAFHGVNSASTASSNTNRQDFLLQPVLTATRATGAEVTAFLPTPSPGAPNGAATAGFVGDTHFSVDRGFFDAPFAVAITTTTPGASIRYTTDGSLPSDTLGTLYTGPITVSTTTTLRAIAYLAGYTPSNVDTQTYLFLDDVLTQSAADVTQPYATWGHDKGDADTTSGYNLDDESDWELDPQIVTGNQAAIKAGLTAIPTVSLVMDWDDLFGGAPQPGTFAGTTTVAPQPQGIYIHGSSSERYASLEYFNPASPTDTFHLDVGVETQGHSSTLRWNSDKLSLQVKFKAPYGPSELNYPVFGGALYGDGGATEYDTLILDAGYNYHWHHANAQQRDYARFVTDQVLSDLQNAASGEGAPNGKYVHLYLNGLYWGLYNLHERPDESFAAAYYGGDKDNYDVIKHANQDVAHEYTWVEGGVAAEQRFATLLNDTQAVQNNPTSSSLYETVRAQLDIDQYIDYMIAHYYGGNAADWSHNNWYATRDRTGGLWRFHAWDQEHAIPTADNGDAFDQNVNLTGKDDAEAPTAIHKNLIANAEYRLRFADRAQALLRNDGALTPAAAQAVYQARIDEINQAILGESARWGDNRNETDPYTRADFLAVNNAVIADYFPGRTATTLAQFQTAGWLVTLAAPTLTQYGGEVAAGFDVTLALPAGAPIGAQLVYTLDGTDPRLAGGGLAPGALTATGPVVIDIATAMRVQSRVLSAGDWSAVIDATFTLAQPPALRVVEVHYNPPGSGDATEYLELLNFGVTPIDLAGYRLTDFSTLGYTFTGGTIAAGERIVVVKNQAAFAAAYPGVTNVASGVFDGSLANEGEAITLRSPLDELIQSFIYGDSNIAGWPTNPDGNGPSLEYIGPFNQDLEDPAQTAGDPYDTASNWRASLLATGSPGTDGALLPGDYDRNGAVNQADHTFWSASYGATAGVALQADGNNDGLVDAADYAVWRDHLGAGSFALATVALDEALAEVTANETPPQARLAYFAAPAPRARFTPAVRTPVAEPVSTTRDASLLLALATQPVATPATTVEPETLAESDDSAHDDALLDLASEPAVRGRHSVEL